MGQKYRNQKKRRRQEKQLRKEKQRRRQRREKIGQVPHVTQHRKPLANEYVEPSMVTGLVRRGATVLQSLQLDHHFKIDALIVKDDSLGRLPKPIGLQITCSLGKKGKMDTFVRRAVTWVGIGSILYAEVPLLITRTVCNAVHGALLAIWENPQRRNRQAWRIRVNALGHCQWFPL